MSTIWRMQRIRAMDKSIDFQHPRSRRVAGSLAFNKSLISIIRE
jgi:hypothetical protein